MTGRATFSNSSIPRALGQDTSLEVSVVIPCLNEEETIALCIERALGAMNDLGVRGEVVVSDNGSTDASARVAADAGARIVHSPVRGYGAALQYGIASARGHYVIIGDADDSYDFGEISRFIERLREGHPFVMGTRLKGRIEQGAMPLLNRYFGTPILTQILNRLFGTHISDCNCGMRGLNRLAYEGLGVMSSGMEFASEMIVKAAIANVQIVEVPVTLRRDKRNRPPHLRPWTDGWRHLRLLLWHAPDATMSLPGALLFGLGLLLVGSQLAGPFALAGAYFDVHYMILGMTLALLGGSALCMGMVVHAVSPKERLRRFRWVGTIGRVMTFDRLIVVAAALGVAGLAADGGVLAHWVATHRGALSAGYTRLTLLGLLLLAMGFQFALSGLLLGSVQTAIARRLVARYSSPPPPPELSHPTLDIPRDGAFNPPL